MDDTNSRGLKRKDAERKWEQVQIKAFRLWISSYIEKENLVVNDIEEDLKDGVKLCRFLELATDRKLPRYSKKPAMRVHQIENQSIFLNCVQKDMGIRLVGIGAEDLVDGHLKLTLGLLWSLFRRLRIDTIKDESGKSSEDGLLSWLRKMTEGYPHVNITSFKDSFNDGMAFSALIHSMDPEALDFESLNPDEREQNLSNAFAVAEQKLGIPQLLEPEDLLNGNPDERSVILYTSLFFHAYIADSEKRKLEGQRSSIATKVSDLEAKLASANDESEELRRLNKELEEKTRQLQLELEERSSSASNLDELVAQLKAEIAYLRAKAIQDAEYRMLLEDKINVLEALLGDSMAEKGAMTEEQRKLLAEIEEMKRRAEELGSEADSMSEERSRMLTSAEDRERRLAEMEDRKSRMQSELQALRDRVSKEIERRKAKAAEVVRLKAELEKLKTKQIVQSQARIGLDVLKHNLEEHLEDLYAWRDLHETDLKDELQEFDLNTVMKELSDKSFEDQLKVLDDRLQQENNALEKVIRLKDAQAKLNDSVIKAGYLTMKGRKEWRKRWFKLSGGSLTYYEDEEAQEVAGCIKLDQGCDVVRQKAVKEDESSNKKVWPLKVTVGDRKLFVRAASKKERHSWFLVLTSAIAHENYMNGCKAANERPDTRITALFASSKTPNLSLNDRPLSETAVGALVKGLPGRDEIEAVSLKNTDLDDAKLQKLCDVLEKLQVKSVDVSGNKLTSASGERMVTAAKLESATSLNASGNEFCDTFAAAVATAVAANESLTALDLSSNKIGAAGAKSLADVFSAGPVAVPALQLSGNPLGDEGAANIAAVFAANKSFTSANLSGCGIGDAGAKALAEALKENSTLETLDLSNNNIGAEGALAIRAMMSANQDIVSVNLSGNSGIVSGDSIAALLAGDGFSVPQLSFARS